MNSPLLSYATAGQWSKLGSQNWHMLWINLQTYSNFSKCLINVLFMIQDPILYLVAVSPPVSDHSISPLLPTFRIFWQEGHRVPWMNEDALVGTSDWDIPDVIICLNPGSLTLVPWQSGTCLLPHHGVTALSLSLVSVLEGSTLRLCE